MEVVGMEIISMQESTHLDRIERLVARLPRLDEAARRETYRELDGLLRTLWRTWRGVEDQEQLAVLRLCCRVLAGMCHISHAGTDVFGRRARAALSALRAAHARRWTPWDDQEPWFASP